MAKGRGHEPGAVRGAKRWEVYTPAGQRLTVEHDDGIWVATCNGGDPVRHRLIDVALIEAVRSDVKAQWRSVDPGKWTRVMADVIVSSWRKEQT